MLEAAVENVSFLGTAAKDCAAAGVSIKPDMMGET